MGTEPSFVNLSRIGEETLRSVAAISLDATKHTGSPRETVMALGTLLEQYVDRLVELSVLASGVGATTVGQFLMDASDIGHSKTWNHRRTALRELVGINVSGTQIGERVRALIELRNAIAHGNGHLTHFQTKTLSSTFRIQESISEHFQVGFSGKRLIYAPETTESAIRATRAYILLIETHIDEKDGQIRTAGFTG